MKNLQFFLSTSKQDDDKLWCDRKGEMKHDNKNENEKDELNKRSSRNWICIRPTSEFDVV